MIFIGFVLSSGVYLITTVKDRQDKLRYLLNFGGMRSLSYYVGIVLADWTLYTIPTIALVLVIILLKIDAFTNEIGLFILSLMLFGLALINFSNTIGFFFKDVDSAFKNSVIFMALFGLVFPLATLIVGSLITYYIDKSGTLTKVVYWILFLISPFNVLYQSLNNCLFNGFIKAGPERTTEFWTKIKAESIKSGTLHEEGVVIAVFCA